MEWVGLERKVMGKWRFVWNDLQLIFYVLTGSYSSGLDKAWVVR